MSNESGGLLPRARRILFCAGVVGLVALTSGLSQSSLTDQLVGTARAATAPQTFEIDVSVAPGVRTNATVLGAHGQLLLDDRAKVSAPISNLGHGATQLGVSAIAKDVYSEPTLTLRDRAQLTGAAIVAGTLINKGNGVVIAGGTQTGASFADPDGKTFFVSWPGDTPEAHDLQPGQSLTLVPGKVYGAITVKTNATVFVPPGTFTLDSLDLEPGAKLVLQDSGPISVFIKTSIIWRGVLSTASGQPANWLVGYLGTQSVVLEAAFTGLYLGESASLTVGSLTVPQPPFNGQFFARDIEIRPDAVIGLAVSTAMHTPLSSTNVPLVGPGSPGSGTGSGGSGAGGAGGSGGTGGTGGTGGSGGTGADADCTQDQMPFTFLNPTVGSDNITRYSGISSRPGTPACGPINFCTSADVNAPQVPLSVINARLANPNTPKGPCPPHGIRSGDDCRIDPATVDRVHTCNSDTDCPGVASGARCVDYCVDDGCVAHAHGCGSATFNCTGVADDTLGCDTEELFQCTDPQDVGSSVPADVTSQLGTVTPVFAPLAASSLAPYVSATGGACATNHSHNVASMSNGTPDTPPGDGALGDVSATESSGSSVHIPKGSNDWNLFANPLVSHSAKLTHLGLDVFDASFAAEGSLVAGATVFGHAITAIDVREGATLTQCGVNASPRFRLFGVDVAPFQDVTTPDGLQTSCKQAYSSFTAALNAVDPILLEAHTLLDSYSNGHYAAVCSTVKVDFGLGSDDTFVCPTTDDAGAKATAESLLNFVIQRYQTLSGTLASARGAALLQAAQIASTVTNPPDVGTGSPFSELGLDHSIPIGPISIELAVQLYGNWSVSGGLTSTISMGNAQGQGDPSITVGAHFVPDVNVTASVYVGVGISLGDIAGATVGLEGILLLVDADAPVQASVTMQRSTQSETAVLPGHDYKTSGFNGPLIAGIPTGLAYGWTGSAKLGAAFGLASLNGELDAAARVHFLFFSKTFRKKIAGFTGFPKKYFPIVSIGGQVPPPPGVGQSPQPFPDSLAQTGSPDFGKFGETFAYTQLDLQGARVVGSLPANASSTVQCGVVVK